MSASASRRVIRFFPDLGAGPLWEDAHPDYAMEPEDYGLADDLSGSLRAWNQQWDPGRDPRTDEAQRWQHEGRALARRVAEAVREYADVVYEA